MKQRRPKLCEHASVIQQQCKALRMPTIGQPMRPAGRAGRTRARSHIWLSRSAAGGRAGGARAARHRAAHQRCAPAAGRRRWTSSTSARRRWSRRRRSASWPRAATSNAPSRSCSSAIAGTGKTHLRLALCVAACRQKRRVRFTTAAALVNELVEAKQQLQLRRVLGRWARYDLIAIDEVGYVPLAEIGAEFLFQVIAERAEQAAVILTTNLPFSEWTQVIPNARLCKALLDRITDRAHIIETGTDSYRFRRTLEVRQKKRASSGSAA